MYKNINPPVPPKTNKAIKKIYLIIFFYKSFKKSIII